MQLTSPAKLPECLHVGKPCDAISDSQPGEAGFKGAPAQTTGQRHCPTPTWLSHLFRGLWPANRALARGTPSCPSWPSSPFYKMKLLHRFDYLDLEIFKIRKKNRCLGLNCVWL